MVNTCNNIVMVQSNLNSVYFIFNKELVHLRGVATLIQIITSVFGAIYTSNSIFWDPSTCFAIQMFSTTLQKSSTPHSALAILALALALPSTCPTLLLLMKLENEGREPRDEASVNRCHFRV